MEWREFIMYIHIYEMETALTIQYHVHDDDDDDDDYARERKLIRFMFINRENLEPYVVESNPNVFQSSSFIVAKSKTKTNY